MRDGSGDHYTILIAEQGTILKGYAHESIMAQFAQEHLTPWPGVLDAVPSGFDSFVKEPAFQMQETTFCLWRRNDDESWRQGNISLPPGSDPDGSLKLLKILDGDPRTYCDWAECYYERSISMRPFELIYAHLTLPAEIVPSLNSQIAFIDVLLDALEIGYTVVL